MLRKVSPFIVVIASTAHTKHIVYFEIAGSQPQKKSQAVSRFRQTETPMLLDVSLCILSITFPFHPEILLATFLHSTCRHSWYGFHLSTAFCGSSLRCTTDGGVFFFLRPLPSKTAAVGAALWTGRRARADVWGWTASASCFGTTIVTNILAMR